MLPPPYFNVILVFKTTFEKALHYLHFTEKEETESGRLLNNLLKVMMLVSRDKIPTTDSVSSERIYCRDTDGIF